MTGFQILATSHSTAHQRARDFRQRVMVGFSSFILRGPSLKNQILVSLTPSHWVYDPSHSVVVMCYEHMTSRFEPVFVVFVVMGK